MLQSGNLLADVGLLELGGVVLGVLLQVPELARLLDRGRDRGLELALQSIQLLLQALPGGSRHHGGVHVGLAPHLIEHLLRAPLPRLADRRHRVGQAESRCDFQRREQEAIARPPLAKQDAESQPQLPRALRARQQLVERATGFDPPQHLLGHRRFGVILDQRQGGPQGAPSVLGSRGQLALDPTQRCLRVTRLVLARQLRHAQALLPERLEHRLPLRRPIRKPACEAQPGARPIRPIHLLIEHRSLDVASEPLLERGLGLGMLREELAHHGEVGLDRLARLERGKRHVFGRTVLGGGQAVVLLECARVIDARVALGRGP